MSLLGHMHKRLVADRYGSIEVAADEFYIDTRAMTVTICQQRCRITLRELAFSRTAAVYTARYRDVEAL